MRNRDRVRKFNRDTVPSGSPRTISIRAKRNRANCSLLSGKRFDATEDRSHGRPERAVQPEPRSCIRNQSRENLLKRTKIVLAVPSYHRQRLSGIRRGWCPSRSLRNREGSERVIRSDSGVAHRLSLSARVLSAVDSQVKAKRRRQKHFCQLPKSPLRRP